MIFNLSITTVAIVRWASRHNHNSVASNKFERYIDKNLYDFYSVNKFNFNYVMFNNENYDETIHQGKFLYRNYFA